MKYLDDLTALKGWINDGEKVLSVIGLSGSLQSYFFSRLSLGLKRPCLLILAEKKEAQRFYHELSFFLSAGEAGRPAGPVHLYEFPSYDISPLTGISPHRELAAARLQALYALLTEENSIVVTSLEAVSFRVLPKEALVRSLEYLEAGEDVERDSLLRRLEANGYQRVSIVEERGDYSVRGGVIDVYSPIYPMPVRLEFWGDRLESIRQFDPLSQRSLGHLQEMVLLPANEIIMDEPAIKRARSMGRLPRTQEEGTGFSGQEAWIAHFYEGLDTIFNYLPSNGLVTVIDLEHAGVSASKRIAERFQADVERYQKEAAERGVPFPIVEGNLVPFEEITANLDLRQRIEFSAIDFYSDDERGKKIHIKGEFFLEEGLSVCLTGKGRVSIAPLAERISKWLEDRARVVLVSRTEQQADRIIKILKNYDVNFAQIVESWAEVPSGPGLTVCIGRLSKGFTWSDIGLHVISEDEIFGPKKGLARREKAKREGINWTSFSQLKAGDFVVHEEHGIGRYEGLLNMEIRGKANDFVVIEYADNARLYIPADRINIIQKYAGADERNPKLDQLGGRSFDVAKEKAKNSVKRIARQLVELYALRSHRKGHAYSFPDNYFREFEATFEHEETPDQIKAIESVMDDMTSDKPMDRLICGDVGFGKTEIAVRAAFKAVMDGKQVAFLVPTTVLAEQHYETFRKRFQDYPVRVGILSRFKSRAEQTRILGELRTGKIDILIGTHRIIQKDVKFGDLGLLMIDEEQRFGVRQKEALKKFRALVDVLAITATPVPRTLQMSMMGVRDLSIIETPPEDRLSIQTHMSHYDESLIARAINFEVERGGQVFFVHNRVQTIDHAADQLRRFVPQARTEVAHGQMKPRDLEETMMRFLNREIDVLACSTIIESGLDIPSANTIIINEVDRLGLAQIYQLRGRVGRAKEKAYAYLLLSEGAVLTKDAEKRLKALMDFSHLGAGLHLAMHDLKIRGAGNILGFAQSGHISAVGYELYVKLIERAIAELKGEEWHDEINPEIVVDVPAFLPGDYVFDTDVRLNLYRRLSALIEKSELNEMEEEIKDRFGEPPREVRNLLDLMSVRILLKNNGITRLDVGPKSLTLTFSDQSNIDTERLVHLVNKRPTMFQFIDRNKLNVRTGPFEDPIDIKKIHQEIEQIVSA
ncbi:Transcription-repair-coupling factor [uncultured Desulfobacterium sp.]|uniref:Transcription-repair-coupling factor n=1 Tax=uncultured Desulfobacterium sp. TaxID=201089 RepID=A0A445MWV3_9BACT|nr:Transcription-repair-coupling factor [uncultured Desulfobacterium sp.]